jgi:hypothetical protein
VHGTIALAAAVAIIGVSIAAGVWARDMRCEGKETCYRGSNCGVEGKIHVIRVSIAAGVWDLLRFGCVTGVCICSASVSLSGTY